MAEISPPKYVKAVLRTLNAHEYPACIVGGCVRDAILGVEPQDWDVATGALPAQVMELFPDCIPTGVSHGTVTVRSGNQFVEVTTFRTDGEYADHRHPDAVSFVGDLATDLGRRDFTINAIAVTSDGTVVDPYHGIDDIFAGIVRCVGSPSKRFEEDALRMLRAFRFSSRLNFTIEEATYSAIKENAYLAASLSAERVRDEIEKILMTSAPEILYTVIDCGLIDGYLKKHLSRDDGLIRIAVMNRKPLLRWALFCTVLLADECIDDVRDFLTRLHLDGRTVRCCSDCCKILKGTPPDSSSGWKQLLRTYGVDTVECAACCWEAIYERKFTDWLKRILKSGECFSLRYLNLNGNDLMKEGFDGKKIGETLNRLLDAVIEKPELNCREELLALALSEKHKKLL